jgi:hypothetical protein
MCGLPTSNVLIQTQGAPTEEGPDELRSETETCNRDSRSSTADSLRTRLPDDNTDTGILLMVDFLSYDVGEF